MKVQICSGNKNRMRLCHVHMTDETHSDTIHASAGRCIAVHPSLTQKRTVRKPKLMETEFLPRSSSSSSASI